MTTREELKDAFTRLSQVRESLYELDLDEPITILDKNEAGILFEISNMEELYDLETGTILSYEGETFTKTIKGDWSTTSRGVVDNYQMFKFLLFGGQFKCVYDPGVDE